METVGIGTSVLRKEAWNKVTGAIKYNNDHSFPGLLFAKVVTSTEAHASIKSVNIAKAKEAPGVLAVITGKDYPIICGPLLEDRPIIAIDKVRYYGEPVALVVAHSEQEAMTGANLVKVEYATLPVINSLTQALAEKPVLIHDKLLQYKQAVQGVYPEANTNIATRTKIRKGDMAKAWAESEYIIEEKFSLPHSDHVAMETRSARAEIKPDGTVLINSSSQAPFSIKKFIVKYFGLEEGKVIVNTPCVGGAFGGKVPALLELLAYIASKSVQGRPVRIVNTREEDLITSPGKIGLEGRIKLGSNKDGLLQAAEFTFLVDVGAYSDIGPNIAKSIAMDCTGPYGIDNVWCDALAVYTNHSCSTSFRGFGHSEYTFCIERALDKLAFKMGLNPFELRLKNAITTGHTTPTQVKVTSSNMGNLSLCLEKLKTLIKLDEGIRIDLGKNKIRAKGISCFWKTSNSPMDAISGVFLKFNTDGSLVLNCGAVDMGQGIKTTAAQILAEKLKMDVKKVNVVMEVNTDVTPEHWKTVASMSTFMVGRAVLQAADDLIQQLKNLGGTILKCPPEDLEVGGEKVFLRDDPTVFLNFKDIVCGYKYPDGNAIGGQILGKGTFIMRHLTELNQATGKGKAGSSWTLGAQAVEIEYDTKNYTYRLLKAATVVDAGKVINPSGARSVITGGMCMGLGIGTRESFQYSREGKVLNTSLRTYKLMHFNENPLYLVEFVETPQLDAPYGARGLGEEGIIGIPGALANALSIAAEVPLDKLPITPEDIWAAKNGGSYDSL